MVGPTLDQFQKLFGKGFFIAAFFPSLLFVTTVAYLWLNFHPLKIMVEQWAQKGLKESTFEFLVAAAVVYLLGYVAYGVRGVAHQNLQGQWPTPLKLLEPLGLALARWTMRRRQAVLSRKEDELNDPAWALEFDFIRTSSEIRIPLGCARRKLEGTYLAHQRLLQFLKSGEKWQDRHDKKYLCVLRDARLLQANQNRFLADLQKDISSLVCDIRAAYENEKNLELRSAAKRLNTSAEQAWAAAYSDLYDNFPDDERWLRATQFGNIAGVLELHPLNRYGINLSSLWPRLIQVIPEDARVRIEDAKIYLDFTVITSLFLFAGIWIAIAAGFWGPPRTLWLKVLLPILLLLGFRILYSLAIQAYRTYAIQVEAVVDLFRLNLLDSLNIERPRTMAEERRIWNEIREFIIQADLPGDSVHFKGMRTIPQDNRSQGTWRFGLILGTGVATLILLASKLFHRVTH